MALMAFRDNYEFELIVNEMEGMVINELAHLLEQEEYKDVCRCQDCILDIVALALNHLKPAYRSSLSYKGVLYKHNLEDEHHDKAYKKVVRDAIEKILSNPSH